MDGCKLQWWLLLAVNEAEHAISAPPVSPAVRVARRVQLRGGRVCACISPAGAHTLLQQSRKAINGGSCVCRGSMSARVAVSRDRRPSVTAQRRQHTDGFPPSHHAPGVASTQLPSMTEAQDNKRGGVDLQPPPGLSPSLAAV
jgi:hypothetical protein